MMTDEQLLQAASSQRIVIVGGHGFAVQYQPCPQERHPWRDRHGRYWPAWMCFPKLRRVRNA
jgi:hypothetical protein